MDPPKVVVIPPEVFLSLERMLCGNGTWMQDKDGDLHVVVVEPNTDRHYHFIYVWCETRFFLWSFCVVPNDEEPEEDDE